MGLVLKNNKYHLTIDSKTIIGVMGDYEKFIRNITSDNVYFIDKLVSKSNKRVSSLISDTDIIKEFDFNEENLEKKVYELSHSDQKLLQYILMVLSNKKIIIIDEPYLDLDYNNKKKITLLLRKLSKDKTIIIGSNQSNLIYSLCNKVLLVNNSEYYYGDSNVFKDKELLDKYHIKIPDLVLFTMLANNKNKKIGYFKDIRDLIKDVYRNVSKK